MPDSPRAPKGLQSRGRAFWKAVTAQFELSLDETELLVEVCRLLDQCERLASVIGEQGETVTGSTGQIRMHPAITELRGCRLALGRLLGQLGVAGRAGCDAGVTRAVEGAGGGWCTVGGAAVGDDGE